MQLAQDLRVPGATAHHYKQGIAMNRALMLFALLLSSTIANATFITLEPDEVESGTNISHYWDGVSIHSVHYMGSGIYTFSPVVSAAMDGNRVPTGDQIFLSLLTGRGYWGDIGGPDCALTLRLCSGGGQWNVMLLEFDERTSDVSVLTNFGTDGMSLWLYDTDYNLVGSCHRTFGYMVESCYQDMGDTGTYGTNWLLTASSDSRNVRYAVVGALAVGGAIDAISYSVPEPGTFALLSVGLLGLAVRRRRASSALAQQQ